ncbi:P-type conjugative transfer protein TrbL [Shewanella frigidimarina]|uniref:P-type conjugative transfer protein TrbL n=1 Tax=Shewanella frigidimarina TaxID=56812 RepID=UPI003D7B6E47
MRLWLIFLVVLFIPNVHAQGVPDSGAINELLGTFEAAAGQWPSILRQYATYLFWSLVLISWTWSFFWMAFKEPNITELIVEFTRRSLLVGFFFWLLMDGTWIAAKIVEGFQFLGYALSGTSINPSSIFDIGYSLASTIIQKISFTDLGDSLAFIIAGLGILICFAFITLEMILVIIQYYIFLNLGVIMMGFLGHEWSREYGINYFRLMLGIGVKFLSMQMIVDLSMRMMNGWLQTSELTWTQVLLILPCVIIIWGLVREVPQLAQSLISGADKTTGDSMAGAMQAAATAAAVAAGAYAGSMALGGAGMGGGGNMGSLLKNAWDQAGGGDDSNDPATSSLPEDSASDNTGQGSSDIPRTHGSESEYQGSISGDSADSPNAGQSSADSPSTGQSSTDSPSTGQSSTDSPSAGQSSTDSPSASQSSTDSPSAGQSSEAVPNPSVTSTGKSKSKIATMGKAAKIAGAAVAKEGISSAKNAFLKGLKSPIESRSDSLFGRAANSIKNNSSNNNIN